MGVRHMDCAGFEGRVIAAAVDGQSPARILVASVEGTVAVLNARNKKECRVEHHFAKGTNDGAAVGLGSTKGFAVILERSDATWSLAALNMSHVGKMKQADLSPFVWRRHITSVRAWAFHRRQQQGDLIAVLSEDGKEIEIAELLMSVYTPPVEDSFGNYKYPLVAVGIALVLGFQYMKMNRGSGSDSGNSKDFEKDLRALRNKKMMQGNLKGKAKPESNEPVDDD